MPPTVRSDPGEQFWRNRQAHAIDDVVRFNRSRGLFPVFLTGNGALTGAHTALSLDEMLGVPAREQQDHKHRGKVHESPLRRGFLMKCAYNARVTKAVTGSGIAIE